MAHQVSRRGGFSDRNKIKPVNTEIQISDFDLRTRVKILNAIHEYYSDMYGECYYYEPEVQKFIGYVYSEVYSEMVDLRNRMDDDEFFDVLEETIRENSYDDILTLLEAIAQYWDEEQRKLDPYSYRFIGGEITVYEYFNHILQQECVGYRFVNNIISPISDEVEIKEIEQAVDNPYAVVKEHLSKANMYLANRDVPDYENSIKESISAVEAMCEILTGLKGKEATLGNMLKKIEERGVSIHGGLKGAFNALYGYTSDANGIRHAGDIGGPASTFEEAKFMLVSCSAFVNYLLGVWSN